MKSFLAGRRGICPDCGAKFEIPADAADDGQVHTAVATTPQAVAPAAVLAAAPVTAVQPVMPVRAVTPVAPAGHMVAPVAVPVAAVPTGQYLAAPLAGYAPTAMPAAVPTAVPRAMPAAVPPGAAPPGVLPPAALPAGMAGHSPAPGAPAPGAPAFGAPNMASGGSDPLAEAPQAVWYVRPPSGGQFGPALGDIMRRWIGEGRVNSESWVWREGWPNWQPASAALAPYFTPGSTGPVTGTVASHPRPYVRSNNTGGLMALVVGLVLLAAVLLGVFAYIMSTYQ